MPTKEEAKTIAKQIAKDCVGVRIRMLNRMVSRIYNDQVRTHGINISQLNILTVITLKGPIQPAVVGRLLSLEKSSLSRNVRLMEGRGWIEYLPKEEGNTFQLRATRKGRSMLQKVEPAWKLAQQEVMSLIGKDAMNTIQKSVNDLKSSFEQ